MNDMKVKDLMTRRVVTLDPECSLSEAAACLAKANISAAPVVEDTAVVGVLSESDILNALSPTPPHVRSFSILDHLVARSTARPARRGAAPVVVRDAMSPIVLAVSPDDSMWAAARIMERRRVKRLPVTAEDGTLVGIISRADLIRAMARGDETIHAEILHALQSLGEASSRLNVSVNEGFVTLWGVAHEGGTIRVAVELAQRVPGVAGVANRIDEQPVPVEVEITDQDLAGLDPFTPPPGSGMVTAGGTGEVVLDVGYGDPDSPAVRPSDDGVGHERARLEA